MDLDSILTAHAGVLFTQNQKFFTRFWVERPDTYNNMMNPSQTTENKPLSIKTRLLDEAKKAFILTLYLGAWFCAITFLAATALRTRPIPETIFGLAMIKAAICAKFMLIGQAAYPLTINKKHGIIPSLLAESVIYSIIVLLLSYLESGVDGLIHGRNFIDSLLSFGHADPIYILALSIIYWLIIWPYLLFIGMKKALGDDATFEILFGPRKTGQ